MVTGCSFGAALCVRVTVGFATARLDVVTALEVGDGAGVLLATGALELGVSVLAGWLA